MPKILITGNGFDLNIGLPTSYTDFIRILKYLETNDQYDFTTIYSISSNFDLLKKNYSEIVFSVENIEILQTEIKDNLWFQFFKNELEIETWIDFENKIEYVLDKLFSTIELIKENIFSNGSLSLQSNNFNYQLFNKNIEIIEVLRSFGIIESSFDHIIINETYLISKYGYYIDIDLDRITRVLIKELTEFRIIFSRYITTFVFPLYTKLKVNIDKSDFTKFSKHYTFNYTPSFEKIYKSSCPTSFLHGKIDNYLDKIVMGINDIPNRVVDSKYFIPFTKYFQKLSLSTDYIFLKEFQNKKNANYSFYFWGHSLDKSDADYINEVFDFIMASTAKDKKIIVIYHSEISRDKMLVNLLSIRGKQNIVDLMREKNLLFLQSQSVELSREIKRDIAVQRVSLI